MEQPQHPTPEPVAQIAFLIDASAALPPWGAADRAAHYPALVELLRSNAPPEAIQRLCLAAPRLEE